MTVIALRVERRDACKRIGGACDGTTIRSRRGIHEPGECAVCTAFSSFRCSIHHRVHPADDGVVARASLHIQAKYVDSSSSAADD
jgi:hypothetical protein